MQFVFPVISVILAWFNPAGDVRTPSLSASDVLQACFGEIPGGKYLDGKVEKTPSVEALDSTKREMLWRDSVRYVGLKDGDTMLTNWQ